MGLLDMVNDDGFRLGLGLLAAGGARSDGAGIGQRLAEGVGSLDAFKASQQRQKMAAMQGQMMQAQLDAQQRQYEAAQAQAQREAAKQAALPEIFSAGSAGAPSFSVDQYLPPEMRAGTPPVSAAAPRQAGIDVQRALMAGYSPEEIGKLDALRNIGLEKLQIATGGLSTQLPNLGMTQTQPYYRNQVSGALGGALAGQQLGGAAYGGYGSALGGLLGYFG